MRFVSPAISEEVAKDIVAQLETLDHIHKDGLYFDLASIEDCLTAAMDISHAISVHRGWWKEHRNVGEMLALMHSELSEALEGARKDLPSDHIPGFSMVEEELADTLVRIFDFASAAKLRLGEAFIAKSKFNIGRTDHDLAVRAAGGKQF